MVKRETLVMSLFLTFDTEHLHVMLFSFPLTHPFLSPPPHHQQHLHMLQLREM